MNRMRYCAQTPIPVRAGNLLQGEIFVMRKADVADTAALCIKMPEAGDGDRTRYINLSAVPPYCVLDIDNGKEVYRVDVEMAWKYAEVE